MNEVAERVSAILEERERLQQALRRCMRAMRDLDEGAMAFAHSEGYDVLHGDIDVREEPIR